MEAEFINWLRRRLPLHSGLRVGLGDDAAVVALENATGLIVTTDALTDEVDFELERCDPRRVGRKALAVNLSDLAAMAARPLAVVVSLVLPRTKGGELAQSLYEGMLPLAEQFNVAIAGGDTNSWDGKLAISITALGLETEHGVLLRSRAQPGDHILVTGNFGGSILGKHFDFVPRISEALHLNAKYTIHAAIDVSDGLSVDLFHVAEESQCGAELDLDAVPISAAARVAASQTDRSALDHALSDGEDFELILAVPPDEAERLLADQPLDVPLTRIGRFIEDRGLWQTTKAGARAPLEPSGYEHELDK